MQSFANLFCFTGSLALAEISEERSRMTYWGGEMNGMSSFVFTERPHGWRISHDMYDFMYTCVYPRKRYRKVGVTWPWLGECSIGIVPQILPFVVTNKQNL